MKLRPRRLIWIAALVVAAIGIFRAFQPTPVVVDVAVVHRGPLVVTVEDDGRTRVRERYTVHAPIRGTLLRTPLDPGDPVRRGETIVAEFQPVPPTLLDERSRAEAEARLERARAAVKQARAWREQAEADAAFATAERERVADLVQQGIAAADELESAHRDARAKTEALRAAEFAIQVAEFEEEVAVASLREPDDPTRDGDTEAPARRHLALHSPIDGVVLRVFEESARLLDTGSPILELGDVQSLEIVADFLSQDAVRVRSGMTARIVGWGGQRETGEPLVLEARVRVVEPSGYMKISALGVEEQRVDVVLDPVGDEEVWAPLGDGYRVDVRVETWRGDDLLLVPTGALFRQGEDWATFVITAEDTAARRAVQIGRRTGLQAEVLDGLAEDERVVLYPSSLIGDGTLLEAR